MKARLWSAIALACVLPIVSADAQAVFVARKAAQRIHTLREGGQGNQPGYDFAAVVLEAPAEQVFKVALEHAQKNRAIRVLSVDPGARRLQVAEGERTATLNVVELNDQVSQLLIAGRSLPGEEAASSRVVAAVLRVCAELRKTCEVAR
jgi:hypothetical protein